MKVQSGGQEFYIDGYLKSNLDMAKELVKKDWDMCVIVDGYEGAGKSVLAMQCAKYCDPDFNLDKVCFTSDEFIKAVKKAKRYEAIVYDEAYGGLSTRQVLSETNRALVRMLAEIRQKNLFVFIVAPSIFEIDKYVSIWRSRALLHVYTNEKFERGRFQFYSPQKKKSLYMLGKKFFSYSKPIADFVARYTNYYVVDEEEYRKKKLAAVEGRKEKALSKSDGNVRLQTKYIEQRDALLFILHKKGMNFKDIAEKMSKISANPLGERGVGEVIEKAYKALSGEGVANTDI